MRRVRSLVVMGSACVVLLGCGRTYSYDDPTPSASSPPGTQGTGRADTDTGRGDAVGDDPGSDVGSGRAGADADDGDRGDPGAAGSDGRGDTGGSDGPIDLDPGTGAGAGAGGADPDDGSAGTSGSRGPENPSAVGVLNPQRCATDEPFVLSIDPGGSSGEVHGWLESAPTVVFDENDLPRFGSNFDGDQESELTLWWSIAALDEDPSLWLYATHAATELAHVALQNPAEIGDATALTFTGGPEGLVSVGPVRVGELTVFHHIPTDRYLALQAIDMYGTEDSDRRAECAAIDARWFIAPHGTGDFSVFK